MVSGGNIPDNGIKYSGHKHQKGEKELTITDNNGYAISPITVKPVNEHDCTILPEALTELIAFTERIDLDLRCSALTLDSGFDTKAKWSRLFSSTRWLRFHYKVSSPSVNHSKSNFANEIVWDECCSPRS